MTPCGLYLHIPYCTSKCGYCDFYSVALDGQPLDAVVTALLQELRSRVETTPHAIETIFVGGGTPTVLPIPHLQAVFSALEEVNRHHPVVEFTVEANPGTVSDEKLEILTCAGVDRISMGAQSFHEDELHWLQRDHSPGDIAPAVALARKHGVRRLNLDLIFGVGCQTMASWDESLSRALELEPDHLSCYGLTYEPGTVMTAMLHHGRIAPCDEDLEAEMFLHTMHRLAAAGFEHYEISNYALPDQRCRHNLIYWNNQAYIGVGPSAAGYTDGVRYKNISGTRNYAERIERDGHAVIESERVSGTTLTGETLMLQLRLVDGLKRDVFLERTGQDLWHTAPETLYRLRDRGFLHLSDDLIRLTPNGLLCVDDILADLLCEIDRTSQTRRSTRSGIPLTIMNP